MPTAPTNVAVASSTSSSVTLTWTPGAGDHVDIYRSPMARQGYFGPMVKVNSAPVSIAATGYVDNAGNSGSNAPAAQIHYAYFVFAVDISGAMAPANPAFGTTWQATDSVQAIYNGILSRMASVLPANWKQMPYVVDPASNDWNRFDYTYGVVLGPDSLGEKVVGRYDKIQIYHILMARKTNRNAQDDQALIGVKLDLATKMEQVTVDLLKSKCGAPTLVVASEPAEKQDPEYLQEKNIVFMKAQVRVQYKIAV